MKFSKLLVAVFALFVALGVATAKAETQTDFRSDVLTESLLRTNEGYFFYLFNNGRPAPVLSNILLDMTHDGRYLTVMMFTDGTIKLVYELGPPMAEAAVSQVPICFSGDFDFIQPFPDHGRWQLSKKELRRQKVGDWFEHDFPKPLYANQDLPVCFRKPSSVSVSYAHTYLITREMRDIIRQWHWDKVGYTTKVAPVQTEHRAITFSNALFLVFASGTHIDSASKEPVEVRRGEEFQFSADVALTANEEHRCVDSESKPCYLALELWKVLPDGSRKFAYRDLGRKWAEVRLRPDSSPIRVNVQGMFPHPGSYRPVPTGKAVVVAKIFRPVSLLEDTEFARLEVPVNIR